MIDLLDIALDAADGVNDRAFVLVARAHRRIGLTFAFARLFVDLVRPAPIGDLDLPSAPGSAASAVASTPPGGTSAQEPGAGREVRSHDLGPGCYCRACGKFDPSPPCSGIWHDWDQASRAYVSRIHTAAVRAPDLVPSEEAAHIETELNRRLEEALAEPVLLVYVLLPWCAACGAEDISACTCLHAEGA